jgi:glycosyltransferase involved in cell wall biosynthesis
MLITAHKTNEPPDFGLGSSIRYIKASNKKKVAFFSFHALLIVELIRALSSVKPDVLIFHPFACLTVFPILFFRKMGLLNVRCVLDVRTLPVEFRGLNAVLTGWLFDLSMRFSRHLCDGTTVITPFMRDVLSERYRLRPGRIGVWASGASEEMFSSQRVNRVLAEKIRKSIKIENRFVVIYHGVFSANRGLQETLKALSIVIKKQRDILLLLVGGGNAKTLLVDMVHDLRLQEHVRMIGPVPLEHIPAYIAVSDVGILPFPPLLWWRVSSPIKLMEYLAMGKPVIVTNIEAHRDVLNGCPGAFFVTSNRPLHLAREILEAYHKRRTLGGLGKTGLELFQNQYTWQVQTRRLETYLNSLVSRAKSR